MSTVVITPITQERLVAVYGPAKGDRLWTKYSKKKINADERKIQISFGMEDVRLFAEAWLGFGRCDYTGELLSANAASPMKSSLERIDDTKGYVRGNLCIVGKRVNQLKDALWDKENKTTIPADSVKLVKLLMSNISDERLEELKKKYNPHYHKELFMEQEMTVNPQEMKATKDDLKVYKDISEDYHQGLQEIKEKVEQVVPEVPKFDLPVDVQIAAGYAHMCKFLQKAGREVTITFSQFKTAHQAKKCIITGKDLSDDRIPMLIDPEGVVEPGNVRFADPVAGQKMNELMSATGLSMYDLAKQMRKLVM